MKPKTDCPFCGCRCTQMLGPNTTPRTSAHGKGYQVECLNCAARGPAGMVTSKDAVLVWDKGDFGHERLIAPNVNTVGAVLTYMEPGTTGPCGNTIGADGSGERAVVFMGTADEAETAAREYVNSPMMRRARNVVLITAHEQYSGCPISSIEAANVKLRGAQDER